MNNQVPMNNNINNIRREVSRHVPDEWDHFEERIVENKSTFKENYKNIKIKKAFCVGNNYGGTIHFDNDATKISELLEYRCGYNCTLVLNEQNLKKKFQDFLNSIKYTETNIDFIFYYSGHSISKKNGLEFEIDNNPKTKSKKLYLSLNEIVEMIEIREKELQVGCMKLLDLKFVFKKLFILECCRLNDDSPIDQYISIFKKYPKEIDYQFKESKNFSYMYSSNLGEVCQNEIYNKLSTFTESLIGRISSPRAPGRSIKIMSQIICEDLFNRYRKDNDFSKQFKVWVSGLNMFSLTENDGNMFSGNNASENVVPELFEKFIKEKFKVLFGDIGMDKFVIVENEDPLEVQKRQKKLFLKNRVPNSPTLLNSSSSSVPVKIKPSLSSNSIMEFGSPSVSGSPGNWFKGLNLSQSSPCVPMGSLSPKLFIGSNKYRSESPTTPIQCESPMLCESPRLDKQSKHNDLYDYDDTTPTIVVENIIDAQSSSLSDKAVFPKNNMFKNFDHLNKGGEWTFHPNQFESNQDLI